MKLLAILICAAALWGSTITPKTVVKTASPVLDFVVRDAIWAGTDGGEILKIGFNGKILSTQKLDAIKNSWGESVIPKVMSLDLSMDGKTVAVATEEGKIVLLKDGKKVTTPFHTYGVIKKIAFISETKILVTLLSNEIIWFDLQAGKTLKSISAGTSPLSDMALSKDRKTAAVAGEAGVVSLIDTQSMKIVRTIQGGNVDNVYKLDLQNGFIVTAGQDRRTIIYTIDGKRYVRYNGSFLIYSAALSPSGARMASAMDENNIITVFDTAKRAKIASAKGHGGTLNRIVFIDEKRFVSSADENKILLWELP